MKDQLQEKNSISMLRSFLSQRSFIVLHVKFIFCVEQLCLNQGTASTNINNIGM